MTKTNQTTMILALAASNPTFTPAEAVAMGCNPNSAATLCHNLSKPHVQVLKRVSRGVFALGPCALAQ